MSEVLVYFIDDYYYGRNGEFHIEVGALFIVNKTSDGNYYLLRPSSECITGLVKEICF